MPTLRIIRRLLTYLRLHVQVPWCPLAMTLRRRLVSKSTYAYGVCVVPFFPEIIRNMAFSLFKKKRLVADYLICKT